MNSQYGTAPMSTKICMTVSCNDLPKLDIGSKSDPICCVFTNDLSNGKWVEIGRTECIQ